MGPSMVARTVREIASAKHSGRSDRPERISVGDEGLYLQITKGNSKSWVFRFTLRGKAREMGLGPVATNSEEETAGGVMLATALDLARQARGKLRKGIDPVEERRAAERQQAAEAQVTASRSKTFKEVAELYLAAHEGFWRNAKHRAQWRATLDTYVYPRLGDLPVGDVDTARVLDVLEPIWTKKPETASRVRGRIEVVLDYAKARDWRSGENPARWRGHVANLLPARAQVRRVQHHAALPWREIAAFMVDLRKRQAAAARALEFVILTAARTGEVLGARWSEIDMVTGVWTVPAQRMKAGREHRVPLSDPAIAVLREMAKLRQEGDADPLVFPGGRDGAALSNMSLLMLLRRMGRGDLTSHGFRSCFRDWCAEATTFPSELAEMALAHVVPNKVEAAYRRGDMFERRRELMAAWANFIAKGPAKAEVVHLHAVAMTA